MKPAFLVTVIVILVLYICVSGVIFHFLEYKNETVNKELFNNISQAFLDDYPCIDQQNLKNFTLAVIAAYEEGVFTSKNQTVATHWDIPSAIFFSTTVVTTIGYGHISPKTMEGQIYCVFLAITGIPICLTMLNGIAEKLHYLENWIDESMAKKCHKNKRVTGYIRGWTLTLVAIGIFIIAPAFTFSYLEGWNIGPSLYYVVITLSTVGFGDYVASVNYPLGPWRAVYQMVLSAYVFIGLAWLATVISSLQRRYSDTASDKVRDFTNHTKKVTGRLKRRVGVRASRSRVQFSADGPASEIDVEKDTEQVSEEDSGVSPEPTRRPGGYQRRFTKMDIIADFGDNK